METRIRRLQYFEQSIIPKTRKCVSTTLQTHRCFHSLSASTNPTLAPSDDQSKSRTTDFEQHFETNPTDFFDQNPKGYITGFESKPLLRTDSYHYSEGLSKDHSKAISADSR